MIPIEGQPILTAAAMRAAEERAAPTPEAMYALVERAGAGVADAVRRLSAGAEVLILCGPGNNGADGYVAARVLRERGHAVRVAALTPPRTALARKAAATWTGPVSFYTKGDQADGREPPWYGERPDCAPILVDALFGTGGRRDYTGEPWLGAFRALFTQARCTVAVDLPLGMSAVDEFTPSVDFAQADLTLAIGALKPVHVKARTRARCGKIRLIDLGLDLADASARVIGRPALASPGRNAHKYNRGMVGVIAGAMPGAALLAATAAARAGAGYVAVFGGAGGGLASLVHRPLTKHALSDRRLDAIVVGPGLGRDRAAHGWVEWLVRQTHVELVIDGDALHLIDPAWLAQRRTPVVLTPHAGEHRVLTAELARRAAADPDPFGSSMAEIRTLAPGGDHIMVAKGATTVIAGHRGVRVAPGGNPWLSTAGTGDVLAGTIAAMLAAGRHTGSLELDSAAAGVWLHAEAARRCGASFIADDLAAALTPARAAL